MNPVSLLWWVAAEPAYGDSAAVAILQYGLAGAAVVVLGIFAWKTHARESRRADRERERNTEQEIFIRNTLTAALHESSEALRDSARIHREAYLFEANRARHSAGRGE